MERQSRRELLEVIEQQKEQISRYETRLRDVVRAYKGLAKEKETLEVSLKAINAAYDEKESPEGMVLVSKDEVEEDSAVAPSDEESIAESTASSEVTGPNLKSKIGALSSSLATITTEKAQNEAKFAADKRKMRKERDEQAAEITTLKNQETVLKQSLEETKSKLIIERHEREKETNNNILMIKELQNLLADERNAKEKYAEEVENAKCKVITAEDAKSKGYENQIREMQAELDAAKRELFRSEKQIKEQMLNKEQLQRLQNEMHEMKKKHVDQLRNAEKVAEEAELRAIQAQGTQEKRVGNLEARLQELSESVGGYERLRQHDQTAITKLKEQLSILNMENVALARAASTEPPEQVVEVPKESEEGPGVLVEKILALKNKLIEISAGSKEPLDLEEILSFPDQENWKIKYQNLEQKLERIKTDSPSQSQGILEEYLANSVQEDEVANLQAQLTDLRIKLHDMKVNYNLQEIEIKNTKAECKELKAASEIDAEVVRSDAKRQMQKLRLEFQEHRERSLTLLQEKDEEIARLRNLKSPIVEDVLYKTSSQSPVREERERSPYEEVNLDMCGEETAQPAFHYMQELARKDVMIKELRQQQYQTENLLRELQLAKVTREEKYQEEIEELQENIVKLKRMTTPEGASIEYLKNVVLNYMLSTDVASRNHMLKAIGAVLKLTKREVHRVQEHNALWWWQQGKVVSGQTPGKRK